MSAETSEGNSQSVVYIGDFPIPFADIEVKEIPVNQDLLLEVKKVTRKTYTDKETAAEVPYYNLQIALVDFPGETIFHPFFTSARSLSNRHPTQSIVQFLSVLELPRAAETLADLPGFRFVGQLREDKKREGDYQLSKVISAA